MPPMIKQWHSDTIRLSRTVCQLFPILISLLFGSLQSEPLPTLYNQTRWPVQMTSVKFSGFSTPLPGQNLWYWDHATSLSLVRNWQTPLLPQYWRHLYMAPYIHCNNIYTNLYPLEHVLKRPFTNGVSREGREGWPNSDGSKGGCVIIVIRLVKNADKGRG